MTEVSSKGIEFLNMKRKLIYLEENVFQKNKRVREEVKTPPLVGLGVERVSQ